MGKIIGIDLGTTNSCVSIIEGGVPVVINNEEGSRTTPSVVAFTDDGKVVGQVAKRQATTNAERTIFGAKRLIGRMYNDSDVQAMSKLVPFKISEGADKEALIEVSGEKVSPVVISADILGKMKKSVEAYLGEDVTEAVITVPAYFNDSQRQATKDAGKVAGLEVKRIINEPTAAALAYGLDQDKEEKVIVFDLGGGTFDVSVLELGGGVTEVLSTSGDTYLGGEDFDQRIVDWISDEFNKSEGIDLRKDSMALQRLKEEAEKIKKELSTTTEVDINLPFITADSAGPKHLTMKLNRSKFEELVEDLVLKTLEPCKTALKDSGLTKDDIDEVLLVGGMTRMPAVQDTVSRFFDKELNKSVNPDEVVACGAAIQAGVFSGEIDNVVLLDVTPLSLSIETMGGVATRLVDKNTTIPVTKKEIFSTASDYQPAVNIHVVQGERQMATDNKTLGKFDLVDLPPAQRGVPQIEVSFDINADGIVVVTAKDLGTNKEQSIKIESSSGLSETEIEKMVKDAEEHAEEDSKKKALAEARNNADSTIFTVEKALIENEDIEESLVTTVNEKVEDLKTAVQGDDVDIITTSTQALSEALLPIMQFVAAKNAPTGEATSNADGVVDVEAEDIE